jgi:transcriptional regulator with XRE-family HTH domain
MKREFRYGKQVREMREARAWTQEQLAEAADIETRTVQRVEKDLTKSPETLQAIAGAFDVDLDRLRGTRLIAESRLLAARFVNSHEQFIRVQERYESHASSRGIMAPLTKEGKKQVNDLLDEMFADRELIEPDERELWKSYVELTEGPFASFLDFDLAMFVMDEHRERFSPKDGPGNPGVYDWRIQHFLVVPRHGCFRAAPSEPLHRFDRDCPAAGELVYKAVKPNIGLYVFTNVFVALLETTNWCDVCFPKHSDGSRLTIEYLEQVTGLRRDQWADLAETDTNEDLLQGLQGLS